MDQQKNDLYERQSESHFRKLFAAQKQVYSDGKKINSWIFWMTFLSATLIPLVSLASTQIGTKLGIISGVISFVLAVLLNNKPQKKTEIAARIQEQFDSELYGISQEEERVEERLISEAAMRFGWNKLPDDWKWYEDYNTLEKSHAILQCQKENLYWDKKQRNSYTDFVSLVTLLVVVFGIGLYFFFELKGPMKFLEMILIPQAGLFAHLLLLIQGNRRTVILLGSKMSQAQKTYEKHNEDAKVIPDEALREIQDTIFENRVTSLLVPDWYYKQVKDKYQKILTSAAEGINTVKENKDE